MAVRNVYVAITTNAMQNMIARASSFVQGERNAPPTRRTTDADF